MVGYCDLEYGAFTDSLPAVSRKINYFLAILLMMCVVVSVLALDNLQMSKEFKVSKKPGKKKKYKVGQRSSIEQVLNTFIDAVPSLLLLVVVIGGIVVGIFTATEASAIAVLYTLILGFWYKELTFKSIPSILMIFS